LRLAGLRRMFAGRIRELPDAASRRLRLRSNAQEQQTLPWFRSPKVHVTAVTGPDEVTKAGVGN
jgi:hypothetical protein